MDRHETVALYLCWAQHNEVVDSTEFRPCDCLNYSDVAQVLRMAALYQFCVNLIRRITLQTAWIGYRNHGWSADGVFCTPATQTKIP